MKEFKELIDECVFALKKIFMLILFVAVTTTIAIFIASTSPNVGPFVLIPVCTFIGSVILGVIWLKNEMEGHL